MAVRHISRVEPSYLQTWSKRYVSSKRYNATAFDRSFKKALQRSNMSRCSGIPVSAREYNNTMKDNSDITGMIDYYFGQNYARINLAWNEMSDVQKSYAQDILKYNRPITKAGTTEQMHTENNYSINCIHIDQDITSARNAKEMVGWINAILSSPENKIKTLTIKNQSNGMVDGCVADLLSHVEPTTIRLEDITFECVPFNDDAIKYVFDMIYEKCHKCHTLTLNDCNLSNNGFEDAICNFYERDDYFAFKQLELSTINAFNNDFQGNWKLFRWKQLVRLDRRLHKIYKSAKRKYNHKDMNIEIITIYSNDASISDIKLKHWRLNVVEYQSSLFGTLDSKPMTFKQTAATVIVVALLIGIMLFVDTKDGGGGVVTGAGAVVGATKVADKWARKRKEKKREKQKRNRLRRRKND
eukprot:172065_1